MANPSLARILRYGSSEALVSTVTDFARRLFANPQKRVEFQRLLRQCGAVREFEAEVMCLDDGVISVSVNAREARDRLLTTGACSKKSGGTGLGTKIVKDVVAAHKGTICVESEVGARTTIYICQPLSQGQGSSANEAGVIPAHVTQVLVHSCSWQSVGPIKPFSGMAV